MASETGPLSRIELRDLALRQLRERDETEQELRELNGHFERLVRERDEARGHARDHHLEPCMSCMATESETLMWKARAEKAEALVACSCDATGGEVHKPACNRWKVMRYEP